MVFIGVAFEWEVEFGRVCGAPDADGGSIKGMSCFLWVGEAAEDDVAFAYFDLAFPTVGGLVEGDSPEAGGVNKS